MDTAAAKRNHTKLAAGARTKTARKNRADSVGGYIVGVKVPKHGHVQLQLSNGRVIERDLSHLKHGVFSRLSDPKFFRRVRCLKSFHTIVWPGEVDLDPDVLISDELFEKSKAAR